ncbi:chaperonin 10-like protein [Protomyces lactucae-debilis]|uniref:Chaperonin 10-like protein n=1 Tax=Protomyces lactucae-debilis TaxID=2754530 RepID=A0A1Y2F6L2_PROLT|nr:chaperonin 10-like protein [Protomyces lactucae-debilis]ORY79538.1 chaperonin 10-like protein [Protomyces lactucae-debilis]
MSLKYKENGKLDSPALYTTPNHEIKLIDTEVAKPGPGQVLVHVKATGVCGSDVHFWKHGAIGPMIVKADNGLGHESSGVVVEVGPDVMRWKVGDRVAIEPGIPCGLATCYHCRTGRYNACPDVVFFSTPPYHGLLTRYHLHPEAWLHKLPDSLSFEQGSLLEPLSVVLAGFERAQPRLGDEVLICGAGPIGLISLICARAAGACPIVITDMSESRLAFAKNLVPSVRTVRVTKDKSPEDVAAEIKQVMGSELGPVLTMECTGAEPSVAAAIYASRFGGKVFVIGVGKDTMNIPFMHCSANEIDLQFQYRYHETWPKAIRLMEEGVIDLKPLVTHRFKLEEAVAALTNSASPTSGSIKTMIIDDE